MSPTTEKSQSPFLDISSFAAEEREVEYEQEMSSSWYEIASPFRSVYELEGQEDTVSPEAEEFASFLAELHDQEFDEALFELANEAADLYESRFEGEYGGLAAQNMQAERILEEHFAPLVREAEALLEALAAEVEHRDLNSLSEAEIEAFIDQYVPITKLSPSFENFLGKFVKKVGNAIKKGVKTATKLGLGPILRKLKPLIKPLLKKVLQVAIGKLPASLQPVAHTLAKKFLKEVEEEAFIDGEAAAGDITQLQYEFDVQIAHLLFSGEETEQNLAVAEFISEAERPAADQLVQLDRARAQFMNQVDRLADDEDPTPAVEQFVPALLPALKLGIRLAGRKRVINFVAKLLAKLIKKFVGQKYALALSQAIVDAGLRLINLEATSDDARQVALEAVADTVEDTVRRVAALPEYILDNEDLLEGFVVEAFEKAATRNFPPVLPDKVYQERPELHETTGLSGAWVRQPLRGKKYYKKYTRVFDVNLTPHLARVVKTRRGVPLETMIQDFYGLPGGRMIKARVHLYEAVPGTWLSRISKYEKNVSGLGTAAKAAWSKIQPLTPQVAAVLLGQPRLGRTISGQYLADPLMISVGQRFYYLEIPDAPAMSGGPTVIRRCCHTHLTLDFPRDQIQVSIFLSEAEAQQIAIKLRQRMPTGPIIASLQTVYAAGLKTAFSEGMYHQVQIIHGAMAVEQSPARALKWLPPMIQEMLVDKMIGWVGYTLTQHLQQQAQDLITATENPAYGLTLVVRFNNPPGLADIRRILAGEPVALRGLRFPDGMPEAHIQIIPGYWHG